MGLLFAAVGINYKVACRTNGWLGGIRAACEFQLSGDVEAARRGQEQRIRDAACDDHEMTTGMKTRTSEFMRA
ncbi:hypothetical protein L210DRAFT_3544189 [Boletus edulis BED1]|uniref:Uncharacterized protein n=1 Tax=Boletus edulis BED1 TaxID=1328754 RepID=A0AAD4BSU8_BOLED|nr:hypothetical protein L210DRAFT_3544189 [Boletus edulis BED1]